MDSVDASGLEEFDRVLARILDEMPEERRRLHNEIGEIIKGDVDAAIISSGLNDSGGNVRRYQVKRFGSGGGYAAVRAAGKKDGAGTGSNSPGAITNYLNNGHNIPKARGGSNYRPRIKVARVAGRHFYEAAAASTEAKVIGKIQAYVDSLAGKLEGG